VEFTQRERKKEIKEKEREASNKRSWKKTELKGHELLTGQKPNCRHGAGTATPGES
jgi:hypothetical protein